MHPRGLNRCCAPLQSTICNRGFDSVDASIACRQLGVSSVGTPGLPSRNLAGGGGLPVLQVARRAHRLLQRQVLSFVRASQAPSLHSRAPQQPLACPLQLGTSGRALANTPFGQGNGLPIALNQVECTGEEQALEQCGSLRGAAGVSGCTHAEDVTIECGDALPDGELTRGGSRVGHDCMLAVQTGSTIAVSCGSGPAAGRAHAVLRNTLASAGFGTPRTAGQQLQCCMQHTQSCCWHALAGLSRTPPHLTPPRPSVLQRRCGWSAWMALRSGAGLRCSTKAPGEPQGAGRLFTGPGPRHCRLKFGALCLTSKTLADAGCKPC